jgi:hypothetical protein
MEALQRQATPQEVKRLSEFQRAGQMVSLHSASTHQQDQAQCGPGQRRSGCSFLPGHRCQARAAAEVVADAQCRHRYTENRDRRHEDERPLSLSRPGHGPATPRPPTKAKSPIWAFVALGGASLLVVLGLLSSGGSRPARRPVETEDGLATTILLYFIIRVRSPKGVRSREPPTARWSLGSPRPGLAVAAN